MGYFLGMLMIFSMDGHAPEPKIVGHFASKDECQAAVKEAAGAVTSHWAHPKTVKTSCDYLKPRR